jgi:hypothetical protein
MLNSLLIFFISGCFISYKILKIKCYYMILMKKWIKDGVWFLIKK